MTNTYAETRTGGGDAFIAQMIDLEHDHDRELCKCGNPASDDPDQICPLADEIDNQRVHCNCCEECYDICLEEI